jgi:DNA-binding CsgD family transcriptional regulator
MGRSKPVRDGYLWSSVGQRPQAEYARSHNDEPALRKTGIRVLGEMPWGTHICLFYETKKDLLDSAVSYFRSGLENNEFCVWAVTDPIPIEEAKRALRAAIPGFDMRLAAGQFELLRGRDWYLKDAQVDVKRITGGWSQKLRAALAMGYEGARISGNAFWIESKQWKEFRAYEMELDQALTGQKMIVLCTYSLRASKAVDILDVASVHEFSIARRNDDWEFLETPELKQAKLEIARLHGALDILSNPFPGHEQLTPRERVALAQIVRGASSKEAGRTLGISPRTIEFHRRNIMRKLDAKNTVDLVRKVLTGRHFTAR